jgi:hypothetical protein
MAKYIVRQGDCLSSISSRFGFWPDTIWNHPDNAQLKRKRKDPNILLPGDVVFIPDLQLGEHSCTTDARHTFILQTEPTICRLQVFDGEQPRSNQKYILVIDGLIFSGFTDEAGKLEQEIHPNAQRGTLTIGPDQMTCDLQFGFLDPIDEITGIQGRLTNLGYDCGEINGQMNEDTQAALRAFQHRFQLEVTGRVDEKTLKQLEHIHDRISQFTAPNPPRTEGLSQWL